MNNLLSIKKRNALNYSFNNKGKKIFISSFFNSKTISKEIAEYQKLIFKKFKIKLNQFDDDIRHPEFMDYVINKIDSDIYIFFDVDSIPLNENVINEILKNVDDDSIFGVAQCDNSNNLNHVYAAPSCFAITKNLYNKLGHPSFVERQRCILHNNEIQHTNDFICEKLGLIDFNDNFYELSMDIAKNFNIKLICDTAEELTYLCEENEYNINLWYPTNYDKDGNIWKLGNTGKMFGNGTIYNNLIYHNFQIRNIDEIDRFINKCKEILK